VRFWSWCLLILFVGMLGIAAAGLLVASHLPAAWIGRIGGAPPIALILVGIGSLLALAAPLRWGYHTALVLDREAPARSRWIRQDLLRSAWFLALPTFAALAYLARMKWAGSAGSSGIPAIVALAPDYATLLVAVGSLTILLYGEDKYVARERESNPNARRRVPEATLNWLAFLGGWPGALAAQRLLRHKTSDRDFRRHFFLAVAGHLAIALATAYLVLERRS
jgi:uncharacterized membrane protein YsdA (DUF1294 family)